jgi:hypothetical protein
VYDVKNEVPGKIHSHSVAMVDCNYADYEQLPRRCKYQRMPRSM